MGFLEQVRAWFRSEAGEAKDAMSDLEARLDADLTEKERRLHETPEEAMERLQSEIADDSSLDAIRDKVGHTTSHAEAAAELAGDETDPDELDRDT